MNILYGLKDTPAIIEAQYQVYKHPETKRVIKKPIPVIYYIEDAKFDLIINTPNKGRKPSTDGFKIRRRAVETQVPCLTSLDTARAVLECLELDIHLKDLEVIALQDMDRGNDGILS